MKYFSLLLALALLTFSFSIAQNRTGEDIRPMGESGFSVRGDNFSFSGGGAIAGDEANPGGNRLFGQQDVNNLIAVEPDVLDFGEVNPDAEAEESLTIANAGDSVLVVNSIEIDDEHFSTDFDRAVIEQGTSINVVVTFSTPEAGEFEGSLTIHSNAENNPELVVQLLATCEELPPPNIEVAENAHNFGAVQIGESLNWGMNIANTGGQDLVISDIEVDGGGFSVELDGEMTLAPDEDRNVTVAFAPRVAGEHSAELIIRSNDPDNDGMTIVRAYGVGFEPQDQQAEAVNVEQVSRIFRQLGEAYNVEVRGDYAFLAAGNAGIQIYDISDPDNPVWFSSFEDNYDLANGFKLVGATLYLADSYAGLTILDISDLENIEIIGNVDTGGKAMDLAVSENIVYVADERHGLKVFDVSNPAEPEQIAAVEGSYSIDVDIIDGILCWADGRDSGLRIMDVSDPANPEQIGHIETPGYCNAISVAGDLVYIADGQAGGLRIVDISDPNNPEEIGFLDTPGYGNGLTVDGDLVYFGDGQAGLRIIDVSDPENPEETGSVETRSRCYDVAYIDGHCYVADWRTGMMVVDVSDPANPEEVASFNSEGAWARHVAIMDGIAYLANSGDGLYFVDVSDPEAMEYLNHIETPNTANWVHVAGDYAYVSAAYSGLVIYNVSDLDNPELIGEFDTGYALQAEVNGDYAYIADGRGRGLIVVDVSDPANPQLAGEFNTEGNGRAVTVRGDYAFMADGGDGLLVLDVSDPENIQPAAAVDTRDALSIKLQGDYAYLSDGYAGGVVIIDISDPENPEQIGSANSEGAGKVVEVFEDYAYIGDGDEGLAVFNVSNPENPVEVGYYNTPGYGYAPVYYEDYIFLADGSNLGVYNYIGDDGPMERALTVEFNAGWNLISINVVPEEDLWWREEGPDIIRMTDRLRIDEDFHHIELMKSGLGFFYSPAWGFNNIPYWNLAEGYQVKVDEDVEAEWTGLPIPADTDVPLNENWNMIAYFPTYELDARGPDFYVLSPIIEHVIIAKDGEGNFLSTAWQFSNMPPWRETQGYQVKVEEAVALNYPPEEEEFIARATTASPQTIPNTGRNMSVLVNSIKGLSAAAGDEIRAYSIDGYPVGSGVIDSEGRCGLAVWGDDPSTETVDGLKENEVFELHISGQPLSLTNLREGNGFTYQTDAFTVVDLSGIETIPDEFYLSNAYPNPFNNVTALRYGVPQKSHISVEIFDLSGRLVKSLIDGERKAGAYSSTWKALDQSSGVYLVRMKAESFETTRKLMLVK